MAEEKKKDDFDAVREVVETLKSFSEEDQRRIIRWAGEKLGITGNMFNSAEALSLSESTPKDMPLSNSNISSTVKNIKTFVEEKNPKTDMHFAAVVAYYYQFEGPEDERKESITAKDLKGATRLANRDRLKRPEQTLVNAMNAGLLDKVAHGHYALNSVGENLVAMTLPDIKGKISSSLRKVKTSKKNRRETSRKTSSKK